MTCSRLATQRQGGRGSGEAATLCIVHCAYGVLLCPFHHHASRLSHNLPTHTHFPKCSRSAADSVRSNKPNRGLRHPACHPRSPLARASPSIESTVPPGPARDGHAARAVQDVALLYSTHAGAAVQQRQGAAGAQQAPASGEPRWCTPGC